MDGKKKKMNNNDLKLEVLPNGRLKFKRGDKAHNDKLKEILLSIIGEDKETIKRLDEFFAGSEDVELLIGDTIFCG